MPLISWSTTLDETTRGILFGFGGLILLVAFLYLIGWLGSLFGFIGKLIQGSIERGFRIWERSLWWTGWFSYLLLVSTFLGLGIRFSNMPGWEWASSLCSIVLLGMGIVTCLAFMCISLERYEVGRGYKTIHHPAKGQEFAHHFARYGAQFGPVMLGIAAVATMTGFALLNQSIYEIINPSWYVVRDADSHPRYLDFLAFTLINLIRVVDILDLLRSSHLLNVSIVRQGAWPITVLLVAFKSFFTLVLVQQVMAAIRDEKLLWEMVADFWSPHALIHERASEALSRFGPLVIPPMMQSLGQAELLTREQRDELPKVLAEIGTLSIPVLRKYLKDQREVVRGVVVVALGHLRAVEMAPDLAACCRDDSSENVRACAADALGAIGETYAMRDTDSVPLGQIVKKRATLTTLVVFSGRLPIRVVKYVWKSCKSAVRPQWKTHYDPSTDPLVCCIEPLRYALMDASPGVRAQATIALGRIGSSAKAATLDLIRFMQMGSEQERCLAIESLGKLNSFPETVIPVLIPLTTDPAASVRTSVAVALGAFGVHAAEAVPALVVLLDDPLETIRTAATTAIQQIGTLDKESAQALSQKLTHPDNLRRAQTAETLGAMGETAHPTTAALVDSLRDENDLVRSKAAEALGRIGELAADQAVPALIQALQDTDNHVKAHAVEALGQMGAQANDAIPELLKVLRNSNPQVRARAATALGQLRAGEARSELETACADEDAAVRVQAIISLGKLGEPTPSTRETLLDLLEDADPQIRPLAAEILASYGGFDERIVVRVTALLNDSSEEVTGRIMQVLPRFDGLSLPSILENLCRRLTDELNAHVSRAAAKALGQFGPAALTAGPSLAVAAQTGDVHLRRSALHALALILPSEALTAFIVGLRDTEASVRIMASAGLIKIDPCPEEILPDLLEMLDDPELRVRANVIQVLSRFEKLPSEVEAPLLNSAGLALTGLRRSVAFALRRIDSSKSHEALEALRLDPNESVRKTAEDSQRMLASEPSRIEAEQPMLARDIPVAVVENISAGENLTV